MDTSSLPPNQDQKKYRQDEETAGNEAPDKKRRQPAGQSNKGYSEDQPGHPVRTTGSMRPDQESDLSSRETGPGCENG
ncbi:MAG TPA: hypothetical protein VD993_07205 [Chitinophagaceae bacterium]|nr:hypothetical protein [Chitinophagaceae bacterium]